MAISQSLRTHCPKGHPYSEENTGIRPNGSRRCRKCHAERENMRGAKIRALRLAGGFQQEDSTESKTCTKCHITKPLKEFVKCLRSSSGFVSYCRDCGQRAKEEYRQSHPEPIEKKQEGRRRDRDRRRGTPHLKANILLRAAVRYGRVAKPSTCSSCQAETPTRQLHAHHTDYSKPLEVTWLCQKCHALTHHPRQSWD